MEIENGRASAQFTIEETRFTFCDSCCGEVSAEAAKLLLRELSEEFYPALQEVCRRKESGWPPNGPHKKGGAGQD